MAFGDSFRRARRRFKHWLKGTTPPGPLVASQPITTPRGHGISFAATADLLAMGLKPQDAWRKPEPPFWVKELQEAGNTGLAMDSVPWEAMQDYALNSSPWSEGLGFLGYGYLAELTQRPEFRRISEIWATECTRRWIKLTGDNPDRLALLEEAMKNFGVREKFREAIEIDGFFGRGHIFMDFGDKGQELTQPIAHEPETIGVGGLKNLKVVEAFWVYPLRYNTNSPIDDAFYAPQSWQVYSDVIDNSRFMTFVGREMPDILKPVYMFGGLSLSQMVKPYVDNYIRNRTSIGNLLFSFSTMVLATDMSVMLTDQGAGALLARVAAFVLGRDNGGLMLVDKENEELTNVSAPLGTTDALLAQSLEQILIPAGIPMVIYAGTTPHGLNASSDGELKAFYGHVLGYNEKVCNGPLTTLLRVLQLNLDGKIDETVGFEWLPLWELTEKEDAEARASQAEVDQGYLDRGVIDAEEVRERLKNEVGGPYYGVDLVGDDQATPGAVAGAEEEKDEGGGAAGFAKAAANDGAPLGGAGVACFDPAGRVLLCRRSPRADEHPGKWAFPGGGIESGEQPHEAAWREFYEETGIQLPSLSEVMHAADGFTTFRHVASEAFAPMLCPEHTAHMWTVPSDLPSKMHPGARAALKAWGNRAAE